MKNKNPLRRVFIARMNVKLIHQRLNRMRWNCHSGFLIANVIAIGNCRIAIVHDYSSKLVIRINE